MSDEALSREDLRAAVAAGVVTEAQAARLTMLAAERAAGAESLGAAEERFELFRGLNDVFVAVGVVLLLFGVAGTGALLMGPVGAGAAMTTLGWALAEVLIRDRRMVLPGSALSAGLAAGLLLLVAGFGERPANVMEVWSWLAAGFGAVPLALRSAFRAVHRGRRRVPGDVALPDTAFDGGSRTWGRAEILGCKSLVRRR